MIEASPLSLIAAALYLAVASLAGFTGWKARNSLQSRKDFRFWFLAAAIFCLLTLSRITAAEELLRGSLRTWFDSGAIYADRHLIQLPILAAILIAAVLAMLMWFKRWRKVHGQKDARMILLATAGLGLMAGLIAMRLVSFHATDSLLYYGVRLNWWVDIGASLLIAFSAWRYLLILPR